jgi:hypothetical protein
MPRPKIFGAPANGLRGGLAALPHSPTPNDDECLEPESMRWFGWMPRGRDRQDRSRAWTCRRPLCRTLGSDLRRRVRDLEP